MASKEQHYLAAAVSASASATPTVRLRSFRRAGAGQARVVVDVIHTPSSRANPAMVFESLNASFDNKIQAVSSSFRRIDRSSVSETLTGIMSVVRPSVAVGPELKGFRSMSANMFVDDEQSIWTLQRGASGDMLVKNTGIEDDLSLTQLLMARCSSAPMGALEMRSISSHASVIREGVAGGSLVAFVDPSNDTRLAYVLATDDAANAAVVLPLGSQEEQVIDKDAVVEVVSDSELPDPQFTIEEQVQEALCAAGAVDINKLCDYYRRVFARSPDYYAELERRIRSHAFA